MEVGLEIRVLKEFLVFFKTEVEWVDESLELGASFLTLKDFEFDVAIDLTI